MILLPQISRSVQQVSEWTAFGYKSDPTRRFGTTVAKRNGAAMKVVSRENSATKGSAAL